MSTTGLFKDIRGLKDLIRPLTLALPGILKFQIPMRYLLQANGYPENLR